jgi:hypothetical protein
MNSRTSSRLSYRNVLIVSGLSAAPGAQHADGGLYRSVAAGSRLKGVGGAVSPAAPPSATQPSATQPSATQPNATQPNTTSSLRSGDVLLRGYRR